MSGLGFAKGDKGRSRRRPVRRIRGFLVIAGIAVAAGAFSLWHNGGKEQQDTKNRQEESRQEAGEEAREGAFAGPPGELAMEEEELEEIREYEAFLGRMGAIRRREEIGEAGLLMVEEQIFPLEVAGRGEVFLIPALDPQYRRLVLFFAEPGEGGEIVFWTEQLGANGQVPGRLRQGCRGVAAVSFPDMDGDGRQDVVLITVCNTQEDGTGASYKVGDVLFQGEEGFYRDWRLSDKLNRFSMNKSVRFVLSFAKEGRSTEFLYSAATLEELEAGGLVIDEARRSWQEFEKLGRLEVIPGVYRMAEYNILMVYLVDERGDIVWSFQPMGDHENLYELLGVRCRDFDGDGLKDLAVLARYGYETDEGEMVTEKDYQIYCQRTGGFLTDEEMKDWYPCQEETDMEELEARAGLFWGWSG